MSQISRRRRPTVRGPYATRLGAAGVMLATVFVLTAPPALADCPVTDPACLPGAPPDPVTAIADDTTEVAATASSAVDQTTTTVEQTAAAVQDHANQAVEPVTNTVKGIIGQVPDPDPIGDPTGILPNVLGSSVGQPSGPGTSGPGGNGNGTGTGPNGTATQGSGPSFLGRGPLIGPVPGPIPANPAVSIAIPQQGLFDRIGSLATLAAKALAFPVALALIVLLFVAVQNRIDRKDPKLALAPIAPDLLRFE
jgi:hypothetical protein